MSNKSFVLPPVKKKISKGMPVGKPEVGKFKSIDLTSQVPGIRPTAMRNLSPWKGFKK